MLVFDGNGLKSVSVGLRGVLVRLSIDTMAKAAHVMLSMRASGDQSADKVVVCGSCDASWYERHEPLVGELLRMPGVTFLRLPDDVTVPLSVLSRHLDSMHIDPCGGHESPLGGRFLGGSRCREMET